MLGDLTPESADVSEQVVEDVWTQELRAVLDEAMLILRKEQRELLNMIYYFEIGVDEAAEMWGLSRQRIYQMESRALSQIRESKYGDELREFLPTFITSQIITRSPNIGDGPKRVAVSPSRFSLSSHIKGREGC